MNSELNAVKDALRRVADRLDAMSRTSRAGQGKYCSYYSQSKRAANFFLSAYQFPLVALTWNHLAFSKNHIVNHNNVNLSDLQKQISDLKNIVFSHVFMNSANKQDKQYNSVL